MAFAEYVAWILLSKYCKFAEKHLLVYYYSRDIQLS